jgi:hypothetical protein
MVTTSSSKEDKDAEARSKAAEEQNKKAQEEARKRVEEEKERQLQAQRDAVGAPVSTAGMTFPEAAKATEELEQPPEIAAPEGVGQLAPKAAIPQPHAPTTGTPPPQQRETPKPPSSSKP